MHLCVQLVLALSGNLMVSSTCHVGTTVCCRQNTAAHNHETEGKSLGHAETFRDLATAICLALASAAIQIQLER